MIHLPPDKIETITTKAQIGYNLITHNYDDYAFDNGRAEFIIETLIEPEQGLMPMKAFEDVFGAVFSFEDYATHFQNLAEHLNSTINIDEFPGYDDYWFSVGLDDDGSVTIRLMVGESTISYYYEDADGTIHSFENLSSIFEQDIPLNINVDDIDASTIVATSMSSGELLFKIYRDDDRPLTDQEYNLIVAKIGGYVR